MSTIQNLLESANPWKNVQGDAARLATKWAKTGLLEGLEGEIHRNNMAMMLENQAKQLVVESSLSGGGVANGASFQAGVGEQWAGVALPLVRKVFGQIASKEFVSVQPMNLPSGLVFFLDFQYGTNKNPFSSGESLFGGTSTSTSANPFSTNTTTNGLYGAGRYSYSTNLTASVITSTSTGSATWATFNFDSEYSASFNQYKTVTVQLPATTDFDAVRSFVAITGSTSNEALMAYTTTAGSNNFNPRAAATVTFVMTGSVITNAVFTGVGQGAMIVSFSLAPFDNRRGDFEDMNSTLNTVYNNPISIPEINVQMQSQAIVAKTKKLKAVWTPEFAQDLNAYQNVDAEAELTSMMSEYVSLEIDLEILDMLIGDAAAGTEYWSAQSNYFINEGATAFNAATAGAGGFYNTQGQWFATLGTKVQKLSNKIHQLTLRGGANFMVVSPTVSTILESIPGFAADVNGQTEKMNYAFGVQKAGQLNGRYKVYKNPYMTENTILVGFRGSQFLETGAVFAPYIPLIMTPLVYDPDTFTPRKGLLTRYAKKMLRPEFYGKIYVSGLNTI
jgi:hypothetical protein